MIRRVLPIALLSVLFLGAALSASLLTDPSPPALRTADPVPPDVPVAPSVDAPTPVAGLDRPVSQRTLERAEDAALLRRQVQTATEDRRARLQARLDRLRERYGIPGVSATIIFPDGTTWTGTSGVADIADEVPVTPDTAFAVASISKTFIAALVLSLAGEGLLDLDDSVAGHLPALELDTRITVRQLLDHTSGLHDYFFHPRIDRLLFGGKDTVWNATDSLRYVGRPYFQPGRGWHYSNTNYLLLGLVAESVGGGPLDEQLRSRFIEPLGMRHTYYQGAESPLGPIAHGYRLTGPRDAPRAVDLSDGTGLMPFTSVVTAAAGAGSVAATSGDIARWVRALYGGSVLPPAVLRQMLDGATGTQIHRPRVPYGLGVQLVHLDGHRALGHSGRLTGFQSVVRWLPDRNLAVSVLTNQSRTDPAIIARALVRIALDAGSSCDSCPRPR